MNGKLEAPRPVELAGSRLGADLPSLPEHRRSLEQVAGPIAKRLTARLRALLEQSTAERGAVADTPAAIARRR